MTKLLYSKGVGLTARRLATELGLEPTKTPSDDVVIRWGNSNPGNDCSINPQQAIALAANGYHSLIRLRECDVNTLTLYRSPPIDDYPIYGRRFNHRAGSDIIICENLEMALKSRRSYFTKYYKTHLEFRVHVFNGKVLKMFRKHNGGDELDDMIRTSKFGWQYSRVSLDNYLGGQQLAIAATDALGLTFGGADIGYNRDTGQYVVFEVNTAPSLNTPTLELYLIEFRKYLNERGIQCT